MQASYAQELQAYDTFLKQKATASQGAPCSFFASRQHKSAYRKLNSVLQAPGSRPSWTEGEKRTLRHMPKSVLRDIAADTQRSYKPVQALTNGWLSKVFKGDSFEELRGDAVQSTPPLMANASML